MNINSDLGWAQGRYCKRMADDSKHLEKLMIDLFESLRTEMRSGFDRIETHLSDMAVRLDRHAGLLQSGSRWTARTNTWAERMDRAMERKNRQIADLDRRIKALEDKQQS